MRGTLTLLVIFLFTQISLAETLKIDELYKKSEALLKESTAAKTEVERKTKLTDLKKALETTLDTHRAKELEENSPEHEEIALLFYNLEPVFIFAEDKKKKTTCAKTEHKIRSADAQGRPDSAPPTKNAAIALDWLKVFCK